MINIRYICFYIPSNGLYIWFQIEFFNSFSLLFLDDSSFKIFELAVIEILFCLLDRQYSIEQIPIAFLAL